MEEKEKRKQIAKKVAFITSIFVIFISISYAFITQTLAGTKKQVINAGVLDLVLEEENEITISDALPMYDEVGMIQEDVFEFRLVNKTSNPTNYVLKLSKIETTNELSTSDVKYYLTKEGVGEPKLLSTLPSDGAIDNGTIAGSDTLDYTLRLWIDSNVTSNVSISEKSLSYRIDVEVAQEIETPTGPVADLVFDELLIGENCKTYDDGTDTFLVGQCSNNYVWYSGKLWRAVLKNNETGAVKLITDNAMSVTTYNEKNVTSFENSYVDQWLQQEFLPTLHDHENYIEVNSKWDSTPAATNTPVRPDGSTISIRPVGLLNSYEYYTLYNKSDGLATSSNVYLNNGVYWWLITPNSDAKMNDVYYTGALSSFNAHYGNGIRPVINMKNDIEILGGTGIQTNPYILEGDISEPINGTTLLSTRYSGEYITFNNELYRIVDTENNLVKITAVEKPSSLLDNVFAPSKTVINFNESSIYTDLENYYQGLKTTNETAYNMIEPNTTWYLGKIDDGENYKKAVCANVNVNVSVKNCAEKTTSTTSNIGLPRVGEMFTSQITRGTKDNFWTLTPWAYGTANNKFVFCIDNMGDHINNLPTKANGARPSMYLKQNVVIASNNTGNGTYEKPYSIELGQ